MKGIVFTEFLAMVEDRFTADTVDDIIDDADLPSGGAYTSVGTYPHSEMVSLVVSLSKVTGLPVPALIQSFGEHLFGRFSHLYPAFFAEKQDAFSFMESIEGHIHVEVRKLYPEAELPTFATERNGDQLIMTYSSKHAFAKLAEGLVTGCLAYFREKATITAEDLSGGVGNHTRFYIQKA